MNDKENIDVESVASKLLDAVKRNDAATVEQMGRELYNAGGRNLRMTVARAIGEWHASFLGQMGYWKEV
jgi:hypothetical protein